MKIAIVGEAWGEDEERTGVAFSGPSGRVLRGLLRQSGIEPAECLMTNVFNQRPPRGDVESFCGARDTAIQGWNYLAPRKYVRAEFAHELERLHAELTSFAPDCIIALGNTALWALCKKTGIKKYRGTPIHSYGGSWKVVPTWHPSAIQRQWNLRPVALSDISKAKRVAAMPVLRRPRREVWTQPTLDDLTLFYDQFIEPATALSVDIETANGQITEIGFAPDPYRALVVPFYSREQADGNYWRSHADEVTAWKWVKMVLAAKPCFGQNFIYDMDYLWKTMGITCPHQCDDTMLLHHALQPELEKGLGFLASIYTDEPSWKMMRQDNETLKKED
jgi:uracil-DNA glycosylase